MLYEISEKITTCLDSSEIDVRGRSAGGPVDVPGDSAIGVVSTGESVGLTAERGTGGEVPFFPVRVFRLDKIEVLKEKVRYLIGDIVERERDKTGEMYTRENRRGMVKL